MGCARICDYAHVNPDTFFVAFIDANGQRIKTAFGEGTILAFLEGNSTLGPRYRVKFPYGTGFMSADAIIHGVHASDGTKYVRRDGQMKKDSDAGDNGDSSAVRLDKKFRLLFGTDHIYVYLRLYSFLVASLDEIDSFLRINPTMQDPTLAYYNPLASAKAEKKPVKLDFPALMRNLQRVMARKLSAKDFETFCRRVSPEMAHKMAALPKLIEKCAESMVQTAKEDLLLQLYDFCQYPGAVSTYEEREPIYFES